MRFKAAVFAILLSSVASFLPQTAFADTVELVSVGGASSGGEYIYPYNFSVNGSTSLTALMCLNLNRTVQVGETWNVTIAGLALDTSQTSTDYRADAWIASQLGQNSASDLQWAVWDIFDPTDASKNSAFTANSQSLASTGLLMANDASLINSGFYSNFSLLRPTSDQTGWTNGQPQEFLNFANVAETPEPSSVILLATGLAGGVGMLRRRFARA